MYIAVGTQNKICQSFCTSHSPSSRFDFINPDGTVVKANGYRSVLFLLQCCLRQLHGCLQEGIRKRENVFAHSVDCLNNVNAHCRALKVRNYLTSFFFLHTLDTFHPSLSSSLTKGLQLMVAHAVNLMEACSAPHLFNDGELSQAFKKLVNTEHMERDVFYGRCFGFQVSCELFGEIFLAYIQ